MKININIEKIPCPNCGKFTLKRYGEVIINGETFLYRCDTCNKTTTMEELVEQNEAYKEALYFDGGDSEYTDWSTSADEGIS